MTIALVVASCALVYWNHRPFEEAFTLAPLDRAVHVTSRPGGPLTDATSPGLAAGRSPMLRAFNEDRAILQCYEPLVLTGDVRPDRPAVFADAGGRVTDIDFAPGRIRFQASAGGTAGRIFLNQRYVERRHGDAGRVAVGPQTGLGYAMLATGVALAALTWRRTLPFVRAGMGFRSPSSSRPSRLA
jgi:hypothetical protein